MDGERVLCVRRAEILGGRPLPQGFDVGLADAVVASAERAGEFRPRAEVEEDPSLKQVIPYVVVVRGDAVLVLRRRRGQTEKRLHDKVSIGVGGHINPVEAEGPGGGLAGAVERGMLRELNEELEIDGPLPAHRVGAINDDSNPVGGVHVGVVYLADAAGARVEVRERDLMEGAFLPRAEARNLMDSMETWSRIVYGALLGTCTPRSGGEAAGSGSAVLWTA